MTKILLPKLSYKIMGILFKVQNELGPSLLEKHYQRAVQKELNDSHLSFEKEKSVQLSYRGEKIGNYFLDFVVENLVILEIKSKEHYSPKFFKQAIAYLKELNAPLAIIANFKGSKIRYKRIVNPKFKDIDMEEIDDRFE